MSESFEKKIPNPVDYYVENCPPVEKIIAGAIAGIHKITGLDLNIIEKAKIKEIAQAVHDQLIDQQPSTGWGNPPIRETMTRFLFDYYSIDRPYTEWGGLVWSR